MASWLSEGVSDWYSQQFNKYDQYSQVVRKYTLPGYLFDKATGGKVYDGYSDFLNTEKSKSDLRGSEIVSFLSGLPIFGSLIRGIQGVNQLEDLYNNTGKVSYYPGIQTAGASGLATGGFGFGRMASGTNDLYKFYTGDEKDPMFG